MKTARDERETFNVDEQDTQRTIDAMAAARRHVYGRVFSSSEFIDDHYF